MKTRAAAGTSTMILADPLGACGDAHRAGNETLRITMAASIELRHVDFIIHPLVASQ
jgi:hypothetical protein